VPADDREYAIKMKKIDKLNSIMRTKRLTNISELKKSFFSNLAIYFKKSIYACLPYTYLQKKIRSIATDKSCATSNCVDNVVYNIYSKKCTKFDESVMDEYIRLPFEGHLFCAVKNYDTVLKKMYGDYMQLPPEEKRVPVHGFKAYWRDF
jgi:phosphorylcholine metabolism protein LicD